MVKRIVTIEAAVLYLRMSSGRQEQSIPTQREALLAYAEKQGYRIVGEYLDEAISGDDTSRRAGFLRMREDTSKGEFSIILCWDQDRFGRFDPIEAGHWILPFRNAGVRLETVAQGRVDWCDLAGRLIYMVQQEGKHQFLRDLARNTLRGLIARAKTGVWVAGPPPYGYELGDDEHLVLGDRKEVATVRKIFELRLFGMGYRTIARKLNDDRLVSPSGGKWSHDAVRLVLEREAYYGVVSLGGRRQGKYFTASNDEVTPVKAGPRQATVATRVEGAHPAIVDKATWQAAQAIKLGKPKPHFYAGGEGAPLAGLLRCGCCGAVMYSQSLQRKSGQRNPNYVCSTYHKGKGCGYCSVPQDSILSSVADAIRNNVLKGSLPALEKAVKAEIERQATAQAPETETRAVERKIVALDKQIAQATDRLVTVSASLVPAVEKKLLDLKRQRDELAAIVEVKAPEKPRLDPKKVAAEFWRLGEIFTKSRPSEIRRTLSKFVESITLEFKPGQRSGRGQKYEFVRGSVKLHPKALASPVTGR